MVSSITKTLVKAGSSYLIRYRYSVFTELGLVYGGALRADVLGFGTDRSLVCLEVKSTIQDFRNDSKWTMYIPYCDKLYFVFSEPVYTKHKTELRSKIGEHGAGILVLDNSTGYLRVRRKCVVTPMDEERRHRLICRMAWRSGTNISKSRRHRYYIYV